MSKSPLAGKVAIVTGAARRIGAEIAQCLHREGMNIILHYYASEEEAIKLSEDLNKKRENSAYAIRGDLNISESEKALIEKAVSIWDRLDVLVNNASRFYRTTLGKVTDYAWDDLMNSNLKAPFFLSQAAFPYLVEREGSIINITDIHAEHPLSEYSVYSISKGGLLMMTKALAREVGPKVRVNAVAPGAIMWPEGENQLTEAEKQTILTRTALGRAGKASDIAKTVLFLIRDADYITGQVINVDGGRTI